MSLKRALQLKDCSDLQYYRSEFPEIYQTFDRKCLKCDRSFLSKHRFIRICEKCKINQTKVKEIKGYLK